MFEWSSLPKLNSNWVLNDMAVYLLLFPGGYFYQIENDYYFLETLFCNIDLKSCLKCIWGYVDCFLLLDSLLMTLMTFEVDVRIWHIPTNACIMTRFFLSLNLQVNVWVEYDRLCFIQFNTHSYPSTLNTSTFFVGCGWWKKYRERASEWVNATTTTNKDTLFCFVLAKFDTNHSLFIFISLFLFLSVVFFSPETIVVYKHCWKQTALQNNELNCAIQCVSEELNEPNQKWSSNRKSGECHCINNINFLLVECDLIIGRKS